MTKAKNISYKQLAVLLVLSRLFSDGADLRAVEAGYSMQRFTALIISYAILFLLYLPLIFLAYRNPGESVISIIAGKSKVLGWLCGMFIALALLASAVSTMCSMSLYASSTVLSEAPLILLMILPLAVAALAAWKGIQGTARSGILFAGILAAFLLMIMLSLWKLFDWEWLHMGFFEEPKQLMGQVAKQLGRNSELLAFGVLMEYVNGRTARTVYWYIPAIMLMQALKLLIQIIVLGPYLDSTSFPFFTISALSDIVLFQRLDGINVAVWLLMCIVKVALALLCIREIVVRLVGEKAGRRTVWIGAAVIALASLVLGGTSSASLSMDGISSSYVILLIGGVLIPVIGLIAVKMRNRGESGASEKSG